VDIVLYALYGALVIWLVDIVLYAILFYAWFNVHGWIVIILCSASAIDSFNKLDSTVLWRNYHRNWMYFDRCLCVK